MAIARALTFKVTRQTPELIPPTKLTPYEIKPLSDIDDQEGLRFQLPVILLYRSNPSNQRDPVKVIRDALAKALVSYYPFAGRLREHAAKKLVVECTGEGVIFVEADADVMLQQFGEELHPPFPCVEELLPDYHGSDGVIDCPLLFIQVTRLKCGGFVLGLLINQTMSDAVGILQFLSVIGELSRGAEAPSVPPVWERHLLSARVPPHVSFKHREYDNITDHTKPTTDNNHMVQRSFFFGAAEILALRSLLPPHLRRCSSFELLTACLWRCRTIAISSDPNEEVRVICATNARPVFNPPLPVGYYGNVLAFPVAIATAGDLSRKPFGYALELVRKAKHEVTEEYMKSLADLMAIRGRPNLCMVNGYLVFDLTRAASVRVDFGWGEAAYQGPAKGGAGTVPQMASFYTSFKNETGENIVVVPISLAVEVMEEFAKELEMMVNTNRESSSL